MNWPEPAHHVLQICTILFFFVAARLPAHCHSLPFFLSLYGLFIHSVSVAFQSIRCSSSKSLSVVACYSLTTILCHVAHPYITWVFPNKVMKCARTKSGLSTNLQDMLHTIYVCKCVYVCSAFSHFNT